LSKQKSNSTNLPRDDLSIITTDLFTSTLRSENLSRSLSVPDLSMAAIDSPSSIVNSAAVTNLNDKGKQTIKSLKNIGFEFRSQNYAFNKNLSPNQSLASSPDNSPSASYDVPDN